MNDLKNWEQVTDWMYRYELANGDCYEIIVTFQDFDTDVITATLYYTTTWESKRNHHLCFERQILLKDGTFTECLRKAYDDFSALC